ncbi:MAG: hypothetical protein J5996_03975 [Prevotella sp.]|nr:hypothetical protein [Prevotella sp.]
MSKLAKILVTIGIIFIFFMCFSIVVGTAGTSGQKTPGFLGLILFAAVIGAIRLVWKNDKNNENDNKGGMLQK